MSSLFVRSRTVIQRNWKEFEPKLAIGLLTGSATGFVLDFLAQNGIHLTDTAQHFIVVGGFFLGGWIKSSTFPTEQQIETDLPKAIAVADEVVKHPVKLSTSPVQIVQTNPTTDPTPAPTPWSPAPGKYDNILNNISAAKTDPAMADNAATQVIDH